MIPERPVPRVRATSCRIGIHLLVAAALSTCGGRSHEAQPGGDSLKIGATAATSAGTKGATDSVAGDTATSGQECVRGEPMPVLKRTVASPTSFRRTGRLAAEESVTIEGVSVRIAQAGCAHAVEAYEFTVRGDQHALSDTPYWFARAAQLLRQLDATEAKARQARVMAEALARNAATAAFDSPLELTETTSVLLRVTRPSPGTTKLEVVFDAAL